MSLDEYESKRDLDKSGEPPASTARDGERRFVIQKHDASSLHYDFRIEADGVLKSWAIPKGPSTDPDEKRLAVRTEDHPVDYLDFEGVIPEGEYGGGAVLVWDFGTYENAREPDAEGEEPPSIVDQIEEGAVTIWLNGEKISGGYNLVQMEDDDWLLIKRDDDEADARRNPTSTEPQSVKTGRDLDEIREEEGDEEDEDE